MYPLLTLIADDSDDDRLLFSRAVGSLPGFRVVGVTVNGMETTMYLRGFAAYRNRSTYPLPHLLLLDYEMPAYNGLEVLALMRKLPRRPTVILWSNTVEQIDQDRAYELGAALVCAKPTLSEDIRNTLKTAEKHHMLSVLASSPIAQQRKRLADAVDANELAAVQSDL